MVPSIRAFLNYGIQLLGLSGNAPTHETRRIRRISDLQESKDTLNVSTEHREEDLQRRSEPNKRVKDCFHIDNALTTMDIQLHDEFVKAVKTKLIIDSYTSFRDMVTGIFDKQREILEATFGFIPFRKFLLITTIQISFNVFLNDQINIPQDISEEEFSQLCLSTAEEIIRLWLKSKQGTVEESDKEVLFENLKKMFPSLEVKDKFQNPLNMIIPSFETTWRAVYRLAVEIKCLDEEESKKNIDPFRKFIEDPKRETFREIMNGISVENIVKEILFLYPPVQRIARRSKDGNETINVDVIEIHRRNTDRFFYDPERWAQKNSVPFLTFGYSKFECPAKKIFAPVLIAIAGGIIFQTFENYQWPRYLKNERNDDSKNDREVYQDFDLKKLD